jgi:hypothetical protein
LTATDSGTAAARVRRGAEFNVEQFRAGDAGRADLEAFIAHAFMDSYGA